VVIKGQLNSGLLGVTADIQLFAVTDLDAIKPELIATTRSDLSGQFFFDVTSIDQDKTYYLMAKQGEMQWGSVFLNNSGSRKIELEVNERTTLALAFTLNSFISGEHIRGSDTSQRVAAYTYNNLIRQDGSLDATLLNNPVSAQRLNSLANLFAAAKKDLNVRQQLFALTTVDQQEPTTTLEAAINIAQNPTHNAERLFKLSQQVRNIYGNDLSTSEPPTSWILFLEHFAAEQESNSPMFGPGNIAIDKNGDLWIANNFNPYVSTQGVPFPSRTAIRLDPGGRMVNGAPIRGGGIYGSGFGIGIDTKEQVWIGNFGFGGSKIPLNGNGNSVSLFDKDGLPLSPGITPELSLLSSRFATDSTLVFGREPSGGFTQGDMLGVQGVVSDQRNNIWIASNRDTRNFHDFGGQRSKLVVYPNGIPDDFVELSFDQSGLYAPFDIAIDSDGDAWVTFQKGGEDSQGGVAEFSFDSVTGVRLEREFVGDQFNSPYGIAIAPDDGIWITNNGGSPLHSGNQLIRIDQGDSSFNQFELGSSSGPWGVNIDGAGHVYVSGFSSFSVFVLEGLKQDSLYQRGELLSPLGGFNFDGELERPTGIEIDTLGNVWVCNNYSKDPRSYGAHSVFQIIGLAEPVVTPLIGPTMSLL